MEVIMIKKANLLFYPIKRETRHIEQNTQDGMKYACYHYTSIIM